MQLHLCNNSYYCGNNKCTPILMQKDEENSEKDEGEKGKAAKDAEN